MVQGEMLLGDSFFFCKKCNSAIFRHFIHKFDYSFNTSKLQLTSYWTRDIVQCNLLTNNSNPGVKNLLYIVLQSPKLNIIVRTYASLQTTLTCATRNSTPTQPNDTRLRYFLYLTINPKNCSLYLFRHTTLHCYDNASTNNVSNANRNGFTETKLYCTRTRCRYVTHIDVNFIRILFFI